MLLSGQIESVCGRCQENLTLIYVHFIIKYLNCTLFHQTAQYPWEVCVMNGALIPEQLGLEGISGDHPVPAPCQGRVAQISPGGLWILAGKDNPQPLHSLFQGSVTLTVSQFFLIFSWKFLNFSLCLLSLESQNFLAGPSGKAQQEQRDTGHQLLSLLWLQQQFPHSLSPGPYRDLRSPV